MTCLGISISEKKLVAPSTRVTCLGVLIDTENAAVSIPNEKLAQILEKVLLYVHKCVRPARVFLNRMLELLRSTHAYAKIHLNADFHHDLAWFVKFLSLYNGVLLYDHKPISCRLELEACLTGLGGRYENWVYHLQIKRGY